MTPRRTEVDAAARRTEAEAAASRRTEAEVAAAEQVRRNHPAAAAVDPTRSVVAVGAILQQADLCQERTLRTMVMFGEAERSSGGGGTLYKGSQFMPGGGRAPKGGLWS